MVPTPPVDLNHFFVTVDRKTFDAIRDSQWLKESFAEVAMGTNSSGKATWTGLYSYGVGSYVEIFAPSDRHKEGSAGVAFLTSTAGGVDNFFYHFRNSPFGTRAERELMMLGTKSHQEPFAHIASYAGQEGTNLNLWLMEYHSEYYARAGTPVGSPEADIFATDRYKHKLTYGGMMGDLRGLTLQPIGDGEDVQSALGLIGFQRADGRKMWRREANEIIVLPTSNSSPRYAITSARFSLRRRPKATHIERFGVRSQLRVSPDGSAEWSFR